VKQASRKKRSKTLFRLNSNRIILLLSAILGAYMSWNLYSTPTMSNLIFGKPSIIESAALGLITFLAALVVLSIIRRIYRWVARFAR